MVGVEKMENNSKGSIEVICGPMFAGKTEELIRRVKRLVYAKKNVVVLKPRIDNRYSIFSRITIFAKAKIRFYIEKG